MIPSGAIQISVNTEGTPIAPGLQTLTMTNASPASSATSTGGATIVQYAQGPDGQQFYIPGIDFSSERGKLYRECVFGAFTGCDYVSNTALNQNSLLLSGSVMMFFSYAYSSFHEAFF